MTREDSWEQEIRLLEESHLKPEVRNSEQAMNALLADDFVEFGCSGTIYADKKKIVESMSGAPSSRMFLSDFRAKLLAPDVVLTTYRTVRCGEREAPLKHSLRSTIWERIDGRWQMVFHQGTLIDAQLEFKAAQPGDETYQVNDERQT
jgi:hypothetical protein